MEYGIGREYREAFDSIYELARGGYLDGAEAGGERVTISGTGGQRRIIKGSVSFVYDESAAKIGKRDKKQRMERDGASWFASVRSGSAAENDAAEWTALIESTAQAYHKLYSLLEFEQNSARSAKEAASDMRRLSNLAAGLFPARKLVVRPSAMAPAHDIYGLTFRAGLSSVGESVPVLCKIYFRSEEERGIRRLVPIGRREAAEIDRNIIQNIGTEGGIANDDRQRASDMIREVIGQLDATLGAGDAAAYVVMAGKEDEDILRDMIENGPYGTVTIVCKSVKVLGISHVRWSDSVYDIREGTDTLLRASIGLSGAVTLRCLSCGEEVVSGNVVTVETESGQREFALDPSRADLGCDETRLTEIAAYVSGSHIIEKHCDIPGRGTAGCTRTVCAAGLAFLQDSAGQWRAVCKDCAAEEVVYDGADGPALTSTLTLAYDTKRLIPAGEAGRCSCCGRQFEELTATGLCRFCNEARRAMTEGDKSADPKVCANARAARRRYARFSSMLPLAKRMAAPPGQKYCFESEDMLMFALGRQIYIFPKSSANESGYIAPPRKIGEFAGGNNGARGGDRK